MKDNNLFTNIFSEVWKKIVLLFGILLGFVLFIYIPFTLLSTLASPFMMSSKQKAESVQETYSEKSSPSALQRLAIRYGPSEWKAPDVTFTLNDGTIIKGKRSAEGYSVGVLGYEACESYYAKHPTTSWMSKDLKPHYDSNYFVVVYIVVRNETNEKVKLSPGEFSLYTPKNDSYVYDIMAQGELKRRDIYGSNFDYIEPGKSACYTILFSVRTDDPTPAHDMRLNFDRNLFSPSVDLPLNDAI